MTAWFDLHDHWTLAVAPVEGGTPSETTATAGEVVTGEVAATVPGCVHTDLLDHGLVDDPFVDDNETRLGWIGRTDWRYRRPLTAEAEALASAPQAERVDLVCEGLDTFATVLVGDRVVGRTANMHRSYRFDVTEALAEAGTDAGLEVRFDAPYRRAEAERDRSGPLPAAYDEPYQYVRKMACNFGWDWGPTVVTSGIWRPIRLHAWSTARLASVRPLVSVDTEEARGRVALRLTVERTERGRDAELTVTASVAGVSGTVTVPAGEEEVALDLDVADPELWWPRGHGDQPLYDLSVELATPGTVLDAWERRIGFRNVAVHSAPDQHGAAFAVRVNGRDVLVKGANWIPDDTFPSRIDRDRYRERIDQSCEAGMNLLRVWGGGIYESDDFYDLCSERGVLVWQDFLFACAAYPENEPLWSEVEAEARDAVVRLAPHASLAVWCGNNENIWGHEDWGWKEQLDGRPWGAGYYLDLLPRVVAELDPTRPYWPGSPYSEGEGVHPNDAAHGTMHLWDVWNRLDYTVYREHRPRFAAEFGYQAPPAHATLRGAVSDDPLTPDSPGVRHHQKAIDGDEKLARGLSRHFGDRAWSYDDWHYLTQVNQARAVTVGIEHFRSTWPYCTGTVVWQINDCWPVTSWAAVDGAGRRKPLWYALRRVYADRVATVQPGDDGLTVVLGNDTDTEWVTEVAIARRDIATGAALADSGHPVRVAPRGALRITVPAEVARAEDPAREVVTVDGVGERAWWFFAHDRDVDYRKPEFDVETRAIGSDLRVKVRAGVLLRDLVLNVDRLAPDAVVDSALVTLLPGEEHTFTILGGAGLDPGQVSASPVLRCVNDALTASS
ncbi:glycoside hydrolase family 2 protein [Nocardiopsis sp. MG754419]|uniref:glycoside hydrolase family 2 protein n=1 Tax=Nocardiopsis sp. MG754419 TaxID=2259865 RepID=UPI001BACF4EA|nr:glycoside hydrolase family 2 protein [Nocardiopsis sp. MG754419]MBR8740742.1 glycoside hydrolase family 2 protein [Nocardiopsis sp. MG754419]